ncbi:MAG: DUF998 domain-containing protein [Gammaproteobacteria bacterium]
MWLQFAFAGTVLTLLIHMCVLFMTGIDPISTPVSELSQSRWGGLHTLGLSLFGLAHIALAMGLVGLDHGRLWPFARGLLVAAGIGLVGLAVYFYTASDALLNSATPDAPLWVVASLTGTAMGALQPGLARHARRVGIFSTICLGIWVWMVPVFLLVNDSWIGAYQRILGAIYIVWMAVISLGLLRHSRGVYGSD